MPAIYSAATLGRASENGLMSRSLLTPWGDADTLRERRLPPGRSGDREAARREQRERLFAAIVASCAERGYDATSVEDLLRASGVSRATFYEQFDDKLDCFRAAVAQPRAALEAFIRLIVDQPAAARMALVEAYAAGETGIEPVRRAMDWIIVLGRDAAERMPARAAIPPEVLRGIIGGLYQVIYDRLLAHREDELPDLVPELWDWAMSYPSPPRPLRRPGRSIVQRPISEAPPFASYSPEQRIIRGFAAAVAKKGFPATTIADIAAAASISQTTFYEHFEGKEDALLAALDSSGAQLLAAMMPAVRRAGDWRVALRIAFEEMCGFLASEPAFASLRTVDVYGAGPIAIANRNEIGKHLIGALIGSAAEAGVTATDLVLEASAGAIYGIMFEGVWKGKTANLPRLAPFLTYFALAPFVGAEEACDVATSRGRTAIRV